MRPILDDRITKQGDAFVSTCLGCSSVKEFTTKNAAIRMLSVGRCKDCKRYYRSTADVEEDRENGIYLNDDRKWCSTCPSCGVEQAYTRKDHAKQSSAAEWKCKKCASFQNKSVPSRYMGFRLVDVDSFRKTAVGKKRSWEIGVDDVALLWEKQGGKCALSGEQLVKIPKTWSIDRIDNDKHYTIENVHLVHKDVNMMRGYLDVPRFIELCTGISRTKQKTRG